MRWGGHVMGEVGDGRGHEGGGAGMQTGEWKGATLLLVLLYCTVLMYSALYCTVLYCTL